jgi:hypothetical protein
MRCQEALSYGRLSGCGEEIGRDELSSSGEERAGAVAEGVHALAGFKQVERQRFGLASGRSIGSQLLIRNRCDEAVALRGEDGGNALVFVGEWRKKEQTPGVDGFLPLARQPRYAEPMTLDNDDGAWTPKQNWQAILFDG